MQPETKETPITEQQKMNPIRQWDRLCAVSIQNILAPNGYGKVSAGKFRGSDKSNIPFLSRKKVNEAAAVAAQIVRNFREGVKNNLDASLASYKIQRDSELSHLKKLKWYEFKEKKFRNEQLYIYSGLIDGVSSAIQQLNNIEVK